MAGAGLGSVLGEAVSEAGLSFRPCRGSRWADGAGTSLVGASGAGAGVPSGTLAGSCFSEVAGVSEVDGVKVTDGVCVSGAKVGVCSFSPSADVASDSSDVAASTLSLETLSAAVKTFEFPASFSGFLGVRTVGAMNDPGGVGKAL